MDDPADRSFRPTITASSRASRPPPIARYPRCRSSRPSPSGSVSRGSCRRARFRVHHGRASESVSHARDLSIVYTPLHGVGESSVARVLETAGFSQRFHPRVAAQPRSPTSPTSPTMLPTRSIPARSKRRSPKPGKPGPTWSLPATRTPIASASAVPVTRDPRGDWTTLDGNQIGVLLAAFVMKECQARGKLETRPLSHHDPGIDRDDPRPGPPRGHSHRG